MPRRKPGTRNELSNSEMIMPSLDRRQALMAGGAAAGSALARPRAAHAADAPVTQTKSGMVRGFNDGPAKVFKGVPYGAPTGGQTASCRPTRAAVGRHPGRHAPRPSVAAGRRHRADPRSWYCDR